jgi:hypothetical protein
MSPLHAAGDVLLVFFFDCSNTIILGTNHDTPLHNLDTNHDTPLHNLGTNHDTLLHNLDTNHDTPVHNLGTNLDTPLHNFLHLPTCYLLFGPTCPLKQ